ncbi:MAG: TIGR04283 family arsenosugar biosynthesis glycosyltransferase [Alphaproteobacteria bacterium]|nr:TIGR04283 family arsenosugar biosynthesis glycosyltransferase [Alphaproteobacteria bacterium]
MAEEPATVLLSIVIPTLDAGAHLEACLAALEEGRKAALDQAMDVPDVEIIVADGGSSDDTRAIAERLGVRLVTTSRGRGPQLAAGAQAAAGDWLLFVHADTRLGQGWMQAVAGFIHNPANRGRAAAFRFALDDASRAARILERLVAWRCRVLALPYGDQGLLMSRGLYDALGGYSDDPLMEDVALVSAIGRERLRFLEVPAVTSAARYGRGGYVLRPLRNLSCLGLYFLGLPTPLIARLYGR